MTTVDPPDPGDDSGHVRDAAGAGRSARPEDDLRSTYDSGRVLALSDGVFAIALTLLVLSLQVADGVDGADLSGALRHLQPELFAYALSVLVIGAFWMGHHDLFDRIQRVDSRLLFLNLLYLGLVALLPFPTDLLGRFGEERQAVVIYATTVGLTSLADYAVELHARRHGLLRPDPLRPGPARLPPPPVAVVFLASVPVAWWNASAAKGFWLLAVPWGWWMGQLDRRRRSPEAPPAAG